MAEEEDQVVPEIEVEEEEEEESEMEEVHEEEWDKLFKKGKFKKQDMDMLVMDFLVNKELPRVAEAFHRESGCPLGIEDLSLLETQSTVRGLLRKRKFDEAIDLINQKLGSDFLDDLPRLKFHIEQQKMIELCRKGDFEAALTFSREFVKSWFEDEDADIKEETRQTLLLMMYGNNTPSPSAHLLDYPRLCNLAKDVVQNIIIFQERETGNLIERAMLMLRMIQQELNEEVKFPNFNIKSGYPEPLPHPDTNDVYHESF